jgi:hypothetical protein
MGIFKISFRPQHTRYGPAGGTCGGQLRLSKGLKTRYSRSWAVRKSQETLIHSPLLNTIALKAIDQRIEYLADQLPHSETVH